MSGLGLVLDLLRKNPKITARVIHSNGNFTAKFAAKAAASSAVILAPIATWAFARNDLPVAYCDAGVATDDEYIPRSIFGRPLVTHGSKVYVIEVKPLWSAFHWKNFGLTSLRCFLLFFLPLLEPRTNVEEDDDDFLQDPPEPQPVDLVVPLKKSVIQIIREVTVVTTRRVLERLAVHYVSHRLAWKLLKDTPKSAARKAFRDMPTLPFVYAVSKTTFRGHFLGILASWVVQVGIDAYRCFSCMYLSKRETDECDAANQLKLYGTKVGIATLRCGSALIFASIGAGIGALVIAPSTGQWIGCAIGDITGPLVLAYYCDKYFSIKV